MMRQKTIIIFSQIPDTCAAPLQDLAGVSSIGNLRKVLMKLQKKENFHCHNFDYYSAINRKQAFNSFADAWVNIAIIYTLNV